MSKKISTETVFVVECPRLNMGIRLFKPTWEDHIKPFKPINETHLQLIQKLIKETDERQTIWYKQSNPAKMCIVRQVSHFLPYNKFILIAFKQQTDTLGCITSIYPVDEPPSKEKGSIIL